MGLHKKTIGSLTALLLVAGVAFTAEISTAFLSENARTFAELRVMTLNADGNEWDGIFQSRIAGMDYRIVAGWTSLGKFELVESEDYAYRNISTVNGYGAHGFLSLLYPLNGWNFGWTGGAESVSIGGDQFRELKWMTSFRADCVTPFGTMSGSAGIVDETLCFLLGYSVKWQFNRVGFDTGVFAERNDNTIIGIKAGVRNFRNDLRFGLEFRYGLDYPVYRVFTLEAEKSFGPYRVTVGFVPSGLENCLVSLGFTCYFDVSEDD